MAAAFRYVASHWTLCSARTLLSPCGVHSSVTVWSKKSGDDLKTIVTGRYSSSTVFLSLLFSTEMAVIYSPSEPADKIRAALKNEQIGTVEFWAGIAICISVRKWIVVANCIALKISLDTFSLQQIFFSVSGTTSLLQFLLYYEAEQERQPQHYLFLWLCSASGQLHRVVSFYIPEQKKCTDRYDGMVKEEDHLKRQPRTNTLISLLFPCNYSSVLRSDIGMSHPMFVVSNYEACAQSSCQYFFFCTGLYR